MSLGVPENPTESSHLKMVTLQVFLVSNDRIRSPLNVPGRPLDSIEGQKREVNYRNYEFQGWFSGGFLGTCSLLCLLRE